MPPSKIMKKIRPWHVLLGAFFSGVILVALVWQLSPTMLDWGIRYLASEAETDDFDMDIERIDPWGVSIADILISTEETDLSVGSLLLLFNPSSLTAGEIDSFTLRDIRLETNGKRMLDQLLDDQNPEADKVDVLWLEKLGEYLSDPKLKTFRVFNAETSWLWPDFSLPLEFTIKGDYSEGSASTTVDGELSRFPFLSEIHFWQEEENTYGEMEIKFPDLNKSEELKAPLKKFTGMDLGDDLKIDSGDLVMQGIGRVEGNNFVDLFMEFNGSSIAGELHGFPFEISRVISFVTPRKAGIFSTRTYANLSVENYFNARGLALGVEVDEEKILVRSSFQEVEATDAMGKTKIIGLSLPVIDLNLSTFESQALTRPQDIFFDSLELEEYGVNLVNGRVNLFVDPDLDLFRVQVLPLTAILTDMDIRLFGLSFNGLGNLSDPLIGGMNQVLSCDQALLGEDSIVENLSLTFRPSGTKEIVLDSLTAKLKGVFTDINPAKCTVSFSDDNKGGCRIDFNGTDIRLGRDSVVLEGLTGSISVDSFDPLLTAPRNSLSFRKLRNDQITLEDGNFSISVNEEGEFVLSDFYVSVFGGRLEVELAKWQMYSDLLKVETKMTEVSGQQLVDFFDNLEIQIEGNFSGMVSFSNYDGAWDFGTGFLQLNPSANANIKFKQGDLIYGGVESTDPQAKNLRLTSWALEDLEVNGMGINFKVLENERQIIMNINGARETKDQRVDLDYKPRFLGGLQDLLKWRENLNLPRN